LRILIVSSESIPGAEGRNLKLAAELIARGHSVRHTGPSRAMVEQGLLLTTYPDEFAQRPEARQCRTELFSTWAELNRLIDWAQVVVLSSVKGYAQTADYAHQMGKVIIWHLDFLFHMWCQRADLVAVAGYFDLHRVAVLTGLDTSKIQVTGSVMFDLAAPRQERLSRTEFCRKYGLDPDKKIAVWLPGTPASHHPNISETYRRICRTVTEQPDFELIIKPHPRDYDGVKQGRRYEDVQTPTWQQIAPGFKVCQAQDKWDCFRHAEVLISRHSMVCVEAGLLRKPIIFVDMLEYCLDRMALHQPYLRQMLPQDRLSGPHIKEMNLPKALENVLLSPIEPAARKRLIRALARYSRSFPTGLPEYIGVECSLSRLAQVLSSGGYRPQDEAVYRDYVTKYCRSDDGQAFVRLADVVESVQEDPVLAVKLTRARSKTRQTLNRAAWLGRGLRLRLAGRLGR